MPAFEYFSFTRSDLGRRNKKSPVNNFIGAAATKKRSEGIELTTDATSREKGRRKGTRFSSALKKDKEKSFQFPWFVRFWNNAATLSSFSWKKHTYRIHSPAISPLRLPFTFFFLFLSLHFPPFLSPNFGSQLASSQRTFEKRRSRIAQMSGGTRFYVLIFAIGIPPCRGTIIVTPQKLFLLRQRFSTERLFKGVIVTYTIFPLNRDHHVCPLDNFLLVVPPGRDFSLMLDDYSEI